ncbi:hypothetical protein BH11CYA1_BH11CYA1_41080 [soil metagenome]
MSDLEPKRTLEHDEKALDSSNGRAFDAGTCNVESAQVKAAENANPNRHSGSAGGDQEHSLEIVGFGATVSRKTQITEKDLPKVPTETETPKSFYATESADKKHLTLKGSVEEVVVTPQAILERIGSLPLDKQAQIVGTGIVTFQQELDHQKYRIFVGAVAGFGDAAVSLTEGVENLGKSVCAVAEFSKELVTNDPAALDKAAQAKEATGKLFVGCVGLFTIADSYLGDVGATGDYAKPFRDIAWLGQKIDERWQAMSPEEKTRIVTKAATENLAGLAVGLGTAKLAKSMHVVEALEQLGKDASQLGGAARAKSGKFIESMLDELLPQPMGVTPDGHLIPIPRTPKDSFVEVLKPKAPNENVMLSKADDFGESSPKLKDGSKPLRDTEKEIKAALEKFPPSEKFALEIKRIADSLDDEELSFLATKGIQIAPIRRMTDLFPDDLPSMLGCFDRNHKRIFLAEEVWSREGWIKNTDAMFGIRHEFGHAFNALTNKFGMYLSEGEEFVAAFKSDYSKLTPTQIKDMQLFTEKRVTWEQLRDEIFADMYAHSTGLTTNNPGSIKMKNAFPNCLRLMREEY